MTEYDPIQALREQLMGLSEIQRVLGAQKLAAEQKLTEMEAEFNSIAKLVGFVRAEIEDKQRILRTLEEKANKK